MTIIPLAKNTKLYLSVVYFKTYLRNITTNLLVYFKTYLRNITPNLPVYLKFIWVILLQMYNRQIKFSIFFAMDKMVIYS